MFLRGNEFLGSGPTSSPLAPRLQSGRYCARRELPHPAPYLCTPLVMAGAPLQAMRGTRPCDTRMTERHYAHLASSYVADTIRTLSPKLGIVTAAADVRPEAAQAPAATDLERAPNVVPFDAARRRAAN